MTAAQRDCKLADELADQDANDVVCAASYHSRVMAPDATVCLVDGSAYSPSWRALDGGHLVYTFECPEACETYEESFDAIVDDWNGRQEETLAWSDGCLFLLGPDADPEEVLA
jgi:hypothetical protein